MKDEHGVARQDSYAGPMSIAVPSAAGITAERIDLLVDGLTISGPPWDAAKGSLEARAPSS